MAKELTAKDAKLIQYLNEAYGKERELETSLQAHIAMTTRAPYKKRLQEHLRETKRHAKDVKSRIKQLGGKAEEMPAPGPDALGEAASAVASAANKAVAAAKGPLHMIRGTGEAEKMLKNAKTEYWNEFEEIATYSAIETLAETVNDKDTAKLARSIKREEERMAKFLEKQIPQLTKAVAQEEIPAKERRSPGGSRRRRSSSSSSSRKSSSSSSRSKSSASRSRSSSSRGRSSSSGGGRKKASSSSRSGSSRSGGRSSSRRSRS
jgi:ferritin-like metal-binding protein YciE